MVRWTMYPLLCGLLMGCVTVNENGGTTQEFNSTEAAEARITLGLGYLQAGQWQRAKENLDLALKYAPKYYRAQNAMAFYYQKVDENAEAEAMYKKALQDSPKNGDVLNNYGVFLCSEARYDEAINAFEQAIKQPYYYLTSASYENAGLCSVKKGDLKQARFFFEKSLTHDPNRPKSMLQLAQLDIDAHHLSDARVQLFKFNKRYGYQPDSLWLLIQLERKAGKTTQVAKYAGILKKEFPDSQQYQNYLANE
ncbi:TPA: type IV pilus biogenesis/stability protein PilW [Photobacterium damselae]